MVGCFSNDGQTSKHFISPIEHGHGVIFYFSKHFWLPCESDHGEKDRIRCSFKFHQALQRQGNILLLLHLWGYVEGFKVKITLQPSIYSVSVIDGNCKIFQFSEIFFITSFKNSILDSVMSLASGGLSPPIPLVFNLGGVPCPPEFLPHQILIWHPHHTSQILKLHTAAYSHCLLFSI